MMLQCGPLLEVRKTGTHIAGLQPGIAASLAAESVDVARRTFVPATGLRPVDGVFEDGPSFAQGAGS